MNADEVDSMLAAVGRAEERLAERARWPFHRHAMFGLSEGMLIAGLAQPLPLFAGFFAVAMALLVVCVTEDRRRHGFFVSGWQSGPTRGFTVLLTAFVVVMAVAAIAVRDGSAAQPWGYLLGAVTFAVCTAASIHWERIYRANLARGTGR